MARSTTKKFLASIGPVTGVQALVGWLVLASAVFAGSLSGLGRADAAEATRTRPASGQPVSFETDVEPIFQARCYGCHQGAKQQGEYLMTDFASLLRGGESGEPAIAPGDPDSSYLISQIALHDGDAEMPKPPEKPLHQSEIEAIRRWIAQGAVDDRTVANGPLWSIDSPPVYFGPPTLPSLDWSPDGASIAVAGSSEVVILSAADGHVEQRLIGMSSRIESVAYSPDGKRIAVAGGTPGQRGELQIWDAPSGELLLSIFKTFDTLTGVAWSPDGTMVSCGGADNVVRGFDAATGEEVLTQGAHEDWVRDTAFTPDSSHLVSVARDMSCKLTEVATQRFVDNITSITPGALSGGLSSVAMHPVRNEIVVGGADGIVKAYRVFRETERRIGDDANLIRRLPPMHGRVREVAISRDGRWIAAASTLDRHSEVRVWKYDFDGTVSEEVKQALKKRINERTPADNALLEKQRDASVTQTIAIARPGIAINSVAVNNDGAVVISGDDGNVERLTADGTTAGKFQVAKIATVEVAKDDSATSFNAGRWIKTLVAAETTDASSSIDLAKLCEQLESITVSPEVIELDSPYAYVQLIVTAKLRDGATLDVTPLMTVGVPNSLRVQEGGLIRPVVDSHGDVLVEIAGMRKTIPFVARGIDDIEVDFIRDVNPVLSRLGCNQGTCHGAQKGKAGFRLSLRGYDPIFDLRALTDDLAARRINPAMPSDSLMLRKPLGTTPHGGGVLMTAGDPYHAVLRQWIADGSRLNLETSRVARIEIIPSQPVIEMIGQTQQVRVVAHYQDGRSRDVTREAFIESGNTEVAVVAPSGQATMAASTRGRLVSVRRGEAAVLARYEGSYAAAALTVMGDRSGYAKTEVPTWNQIDALVADKWNRMKIVPSDVCDDATFLRRVHLDLTGLPPSSEAVRVFLADKSDSRTKRTRVIDELIGNEDYVEYWTNKWADLLQVNRKFLEVSGSKLYRGWIRESVSENRAYDEFARQILTASGSNQTNPPAAYYKVLRTAEEAMENTTHLFLGIRFNCNKCHDHPFERWTQDQYYELAAYFAHVNRVPDPAAGNQKIGGSAVETPTPLYEIIRDDAKSEVLHARTGQPVSPKLPFALEPRAVKVAETLTSTNNATATKTDAEPTDANRRQALADWLTSPDNPYFARSYVNRLWAYLTGVGLIEPIDDLRAGNPATNPELLDFLTNEFIRSGFDSQHMLRMICNSRVYSLSIESHPLNADDRQNYSHATPRRLPAEVIYDAVHAVTGAVSRLPGMPDGTRAAAATDAGIELTDGFLQNLGRPVRETACECERGSDLQLGPVMALVSGPTIGDAIADPENELSAIVTKHPDDASLIEELFIRALGRLPTPTEVSTVTDTMKLIRGDHVALVKRLAEAEAAWKITFEQREKQRLTSLANTTAAIEKRTLEYEPERLKLEAKRTADIAAAKAKLEAGRKKLPTLTKAFLDKHQSSVQWHPLVPAKMLATNRATLRLQPDRSILVSGKQNRGIYEIEFDTTLNDLTGLRIEALTDPSLPSGGPGRAGNFVVNEVEVLTSSTADPAKVRPVKIASGQADYLQAGFDLALAYDGIESQQNAWAIAGATGHEHWATFAFAQPITRSAGDESGMIRLKLRLHQVHRADNHQLGRFRVSVTTATTPIDLGLSETFVAASMARGEEVPLVALQNYIAAIDPEILALTSALHVASRPVPVDPTIAKLQSTLKQLQIETPVDPLVAGLRANAKQSQSQLENLRRTAAEDVTWALINTPAFLFNR